LLYSNGFQERSGKPLLTQKRVAQFKWFSGKVRKTAFDTEAGRPIQMVFGKGTENPLLMQKRVFRFN
jgi:hypothetical protein